MPQDYYPSGPFLGRLPDAGDFDVLREDWLLGFAESTARAYKSDLEDYRECCVAAGVDPLLPSASDLEGYCRSLSARGYARSTVQRHAGALRGFFRHLVSSGIRPTSPAHELRLPN